ncbi:MAG: S8 family peptidase [Rudaea sp.]
MKHALARLLLLFGAAWIGCSASAAPGADAAAPADPALQILVMLHLPAQHYRPGASYGGNYSDPPGRGARRRIAENLAHEYGLTLVSDWPMPAIGVDCYIMRVPAAQTLDDVVQRISKDRRAEWVQPMNLFHGLAEQQGLLYALQPSARLWHLDELHKVSTGRGVRIAIIDSGVDTAHPALAGRVAVEQNFVDARAHVAESHGTAVAGIIGARADRGAGIVGIAPQAELMALRACWEQSNEQTLCSSFTLAKALQFAIRERAQVINMSLSGPQDKLLGRLLDVAIERDATVVGAVDPQAPDGGFPASHAGVLAVSDPTDARARVTPGAILLAPADDVPAPAPGAKWNFVSGSSFAAAQVSGMVALMRELAPAMSMRQSPAWAQFPTGSHDGPAGAVDACGTLRRAAPALTCEHEAERTSSAAR